MKNQCLFFALLFSSLICFSQNNPPIWDWAKAFSGSHHESAKEITVDEDGYMYIAGVFEGDSLVLGDSTFYNRGYISSSDIFVAKLDQSGEVIWSRSAGGQMTDRPNNIAIDNDGNVYVVGMSKSPTISFGSITYNNDNDANGFIVKYDSSGNVMWASSAGSFAEGVATNSLGEVYVTGGFWEPETTFGSTELTNDGYSNMFLVKYDSSGNVIWATSIGGQGAEYGYEVIVGADDNVRLIGVFTSNSLVLGPVVLNSPPGQSAMCIIKYNELGIAEWANSFLKPNSTKYTNAVIDSYGNLYLTGWFKEGFMVDSEVLISAGDLDAYLIKYGANGQAEWVKTAGGILNDYGTGIAVDADNAIYWGCSFVSKTFMFDTLSVSTVSGNVTYLAKFDELGAMIWARPESTAGHSDMVCDAVGNIFVSGGFRGPYAEFDDQIIYNPSTVFTDIFVAKLGNAVVSLSENDSKTENEISVYPNPVKNELTIDYKLTSTTAVLEIYNLAGKQITSQALQQQRTTLDLSGKPSGLYLISVIDDGIRTSTKVIKQ